MTSRIFGSLSFFNRKEDTVRMGLDDDASEYVPLTIRFQILNIINKFLAEFGIIFYRYRISSDLISKYDRLNLEMLLG